MNLLTVLSRGRLGFALAAMALSLQAAPAFFTNEADFQAAVANISATLTVDSYEDLPQGWVFGPLDRGAYNVVNGGNQVFVVDNALDATDGSKALIMGIPAKPGTFSFVDPIVAFSIDASDVLSILGGDLTVEIDGRPAQTILSGHFGSRNKQFLGIVDAANPFSVVSFDSNDVADTWAFDRAQYAPAAAATPEPGAWLMMASGLAGLCIRRRAPGGIR